MRTQRQSAIPPYLMTESPTQNPPTQNPIEDQEEYSLKDLQDDIETQVQPKERKNRIQESFGLDELGETESAESSTILLKKDIQEITKQVTKHFEKMYPQLVEQKAHAHKPHSSTKAYATKRLKKHSHNKPTHATKKPLEPKKLPQTNAAQKSVATGEVSKVSKKQRLSSEVKMKIYDIVKNFESRGDYGMITQTKNGIAYGALQLLSRHGGVKRLLQDYAAKGGKYAKQLQKFTDSQKDSVAKDPAFQRLLKKAGKDPVMKRAQDDIFRKEYFDPAMAFGKKIGLKNPASYAVIFDTFIHYGTSERVKNRLESFIQKYGEKKGLIRYTNWMRQSLVRSYTKKYEGKTHKIKQATTFNSWRADYLQSLVKSNPHLSGTLRMKAPQWRHPSTIK